MAAEVESDVVIVGAGPCGLFQAFELGLLGVSCRIVEALPHPGGQCAELYPDKPIYDIPGIPHTRADQLTRQLIAQLQPFDQAFHYDTSVTAVSHESDRFTLTTAETTFTASCVVLAVGVGAFSAVKLKTDGIDQFENRQLHYGKYDPAQAAGRHVIVCGDGEQAVTEAISLAEIASVTLLHRTRRLSIDDALKNRLEDLIERRKLNAVKGKISDVTPGDDGKLEQVQIQLSRSETTALPAELILARQGTSPKLVPFEQFGLTDSGSRIAVDPTRFETDVPGLYAIGDVNLYPAKRKLILCGFHEATLAAFAIAERLRPGKPVHLQYTTTSTELRQRLGVA